MKEIRDVISNEDNTKVDKETKKMSKKEKADMIDTVMREMKKAASELNFERATELRDMLFELQSE